MMMALANKTLPDSASARSHVSVLQRKCACNQQTGSSCGCKDSNSTSQSPLNNAPPIVQSVLSSSGQPLEASTRTFMESRFGHDFSRVRVHAGSVAVSSSLHTHASGIQRKPIGEEDDFHKPLIEEYRREHGLPPEGVDEFGRQVGPSDAEIKYALLPAAGGAPSGVPYCPSVEVLEGKLDFSDKKQKQAYIDANCLTSASQSMPPACQFTPAQTKALEEAQKTAGGRVERALGLIKMGPEGKKMATEMAGELFASDPPTLAGVVSRLTKVRDFLKTARIDFAGRTCGDFDCQHGAVAYVTGPGALPIYICPTAFSMPSSLHRTVLHEALHWTGLDADPTTPEGYCSTFDCKTPCLDKEVADAWAHYVDCLGKPFTIRGDFREKVIESVKDIP